MEESIVFIIIGNIIALIQTKECDELNKFKVN